MEIAVDSECMQVQVVNTSPRRCSHVSVGEGGGAFSYHAVSRMTADIINYGMVNNEEGSPSHY